MVSTPEYRLTPDAEDDLHQIARYTLSEWGPEQQRRYEGFLVACFRAISKRDAVERSVFEHRDDFRVSRCRHHYIFFMRSDETTALVLAVFHERMDLVERFRERLGSEGRDET